MVWQWQCKLDRFSLFCHNELTGETQHSVKFLLINSYCSYFSGLNEDVKDVKWNWNFQE